MGRPVLLLRARAPRLGSALWLDGIVCALAGAAVGAAVVLGVVAGTEGSFAAVATNLAYPLGDLTMLAFVIAVLVITGRAAGSTWRILALSLALWAAADTTYLYQVAVGTYREFTVLDTAWPAAYVLVALAACRPADRLDARRLRGGLLFVPAVVHADRARAARLRPLRAPARGRALAGDRGDRGRGGALRPDLPREPAHPAASESEAATDALTGLGNRRALLADLDRAAAEATLERPRPARALRPRRLQVLQRQLRSPGRRRAVAPARASPGRGARRRGHRVPRRGRRVLPALDRARHHGLLARARRRAQRDRRALRRSTARTDRRC